MSASISLRSVSNKYRRQKAVMYKEESVWTYTDRKGVLKKGSVHGKDARNRYKKELMVTT